MSSSFVVSSDNKLRAGSKEEPEKGFEPLAPALQERCSDQLSYSGVLPIVVARVAVVRPTWHPSGASRLATRLAARTTVHSTKETAMAQEKARPTRARTAKKKEAGEKPAAKAPAPPRARRKAGEPDPAEIATLAYLLWERGEPGDATAHWLRAEQELAA